jgi:hypothetical protein
MSSVQVRLARLEARRAARPQHNPWEPLCHELGLPLLPADTTWTDLLQGLTDEELAQLHRPVDVGEREGADDARRA